MHVVVLGAGVIGVTTAYYLSERGHRVTVVDRADELASGASGGNGGQLSYSFTDAMASPALLSKLPGMVAGLDPAFHVRPPVNTQIVHWGLAFLRQCTPYQHRRNTTAVLQLAMRSGVLLAELRKQTALEFSFRRAGKLVMLSTTAALKEAEEKCALKREHGSDVRVVTLDEAMGIEPALAAMPSQYAGAVYSETDEFGDCQAFTSRLGQWLRDNRDTDFRLNTTVRKIVARNNKLAAVEIDSGTLKPDAVVVCLGAWSKHLLQPLGINTNIYPMRGYSLTLPTGEKPISVSITDLGSKMVFSKQGETIRVAGFADFVGYRTGKDQERTRTLFNRAREIAPAMADYDAGCASEWGGFRPMTPDSQPLFGPSTIEGLLLNTGHGSLGWTLACATAHDVAAGLQTPV